MSWKKVRVFGEVRCVVGVCVEATARKSQYSYIMASETSAS